MLANSRTNLFERLMPGRPRASLNQPRSFGREDYVTEVVAAVLRADSEAGGDLCAHVVRTLFGIELQGRPVVRTQTPYPDREAGVSHIDLEVRTERDVVFLENKTGSSLGVRVDARSGTEIDQLAKYQRELDHDSVDERYRHVAMLTWSPQPDPADTRYWRGCAFWWDLHRAVSSAPLTGDAYADRLRHEMLSFFAVIELDPPQPLRADSLSVPSAVQRVLALAIARAISRPGAPPLQDVRPATWSGYLFDMADEHGGARTWGFGFGAGALVAHVSGEGYRRIHLPESFLRDDIEQQVEAMTECLRALPSAPPDPTRRGGLSEEDFLDAFHNARDAVAAMFRAGERAGWSLRIGSTEAVLTRNGAPRLHVSAAYGGGPQVRVWSPTGSLRDAVERALVPAVARKAAVIEESVKFLLADANLAALPELPALIDEIVRA